MRPPQGLWGEGVRVGVGGTAYEIVKAFLGPQTNVDDLPSDNPLVRLGKDCSDRFTNGVDTLRELFPNERIRTIATLIWRLVGNKYVLVALGPYVPSLTFSVMKKKNGVTQGIVFIPPAWPAMTEDDTFMQLGAILFTGAQVVDFYNDRLLEPTARRRWHAYEAEYLLTLKKLLPDWKPNAHQLEALKRFPEGLDTADVELYTLKPYERPQSE